MKNQRTYSMFARENGKWVRITPLALVLSSARRLFQGALLDGSLAGLAMELKPAADDYANKAIYDANRARLMPWTVIKTVVEDHTTNAEGEIVSAGQIEVELDN